jgi:carbonic anhydrase
MSLRDLLLRRRRVALAGVGALAILGVYTFSVRARFITGGAMVNVGYRLQDPIADFDLERHDVPPEAIWSELLRQNHMSAGVRKAFPRTARHPVVAMVVCMDARVDTAELAGDTRKYYYVIRTAGSAMAAQEEDMLELAVANGVKVVVLTTHTDCAAEKVAADPVKRKLYPALSEAVDERERRVAEFLARPMIAQKIATGELLVKRMNIDTSSEELLPPVTEHAAAAGLSIPGASH